MDAVEDYVRAQMHANLRTGEVIKGIGYGFAHGRYTPLGTPDDRPKHYLVAATDQRLVLFETIVKTAWSGIELVPTHSTIEVWEYADLSGVEHKLGLPGALSDSMRVQLMPQWGKGPCWREDKREDERVLYSSRTLYLPKRDVGLPDQARLHESFGPWLRREVATGVFTGGVAPSAAPPVRAPQLEPAAPRAPAGPRKSQLHLGVGCLGLLVLFGALGGAAYAYDLGDRADDFDRRAITNDGYARTASSPFDAERERNNAVRARDHAAELREQQTYAGAGVCAGLTFALLILGGAVLLGVRAGRKHREALGAG